MNTTRNDSTVARSSLGSTLVAAVTIRAIGPLPFVIALPPGHSSTSRLPQKRIGGPLWARRQQFIRYLIRLQCGFGSGQELIRRQPDFVISINKVIDDIAGLVDDIYRREGQCIVLAD